MTECGVGPASGYITTGASGSSFGCGPPGGKCFASSRDTAAMPSITPRSNWPSPELGLHRAADRLPARSADLRIDAAIGDDLDVAVGEQQIDQHAVVVRGVPDPQMREHVERALAGGLVAEQGGAVERAFHDETDLAGMRCFALLDRLLDAVEHVLRENLLRPPMMLHEMSGNALDAHDRYQLPEAPPPPKLPPPPLKLPLSLDDDPLLQLPPDEEPLDQEPPRDGPVDVGNRSAMNARTKPMNPTITATPTDPTKNNASTPIRLPVATEPSSRPNKVRRIPPMMNEANSVTGMIGPMLFQIAEVHAARGNRQRLAVDDANHAIDAIRDAAGEISRL